MPSTPDMREADTEMKSKQSADPAIDELEHEEYVPEDDTIVGKAFRWSLLVFTGLAVTILLVVLALRKPEIQPPVSNDEIVLPQRIETTSHAPAVPFTEIARAAGIDFVHENGATGDKLLPESLGAGAAFLDFDNDGDQDLLLVNGAPWPENADQDDAAGAPTMALYRNNGQGTFENATAGSGLDVGFYGTGVAVGDYDNDGYDDVFIAAVGANHLFHNTGGYFQEVTGAAGVAGEPDRWSTSSAFFDYDNDGDLDLFVCNYVQWTRAIDFEVDYKLIGVGRAYGPPMNFEGSHSYMYRNEGDGRFRDVSAESGIQINNPATGRAMGKALGVAPVDMDLDGHMDLIVANDTVQNFFFRNNGDAEKPGFTEEGVLSGLAFDRNGAATGAMGIDVGHYRDDESVGLFIGNFANEMTSVYVSQGDTSIFADEAIGEGIGASSRLMLSFGLFLFDYDLDGRLDLFQSNGHLEEDINVVQPSQHYEQPAQLFWNCGPGSRGCFVAVDAATTGDLARPIVGRGAAYADIDGDGDLDVLITQTGREPLLLRNNQALGNASVRLRLIGNGTTSNRDAIGARIVAKVGDRTLRRQVMPTRSYQSQVELPVTIGLGAVDALHDVTITWPDGAEESFTDLKPDYAYTITQSQGVTQEAPLRRTTSGEAAGI